MRRRGGHERASFKRAASAGLPLRRAGIGTEYFPMLAPRMPQPYHKPSGRALIHAPHVLRPSRLRAPHRADCCGAFLFCAQRFLVSPSSHSISVGFRLRHRDSIPGRGYRSTCRAAQILPSQRSPNARRAADLARLVLGLLQQSRLLAPHADATRAVRHSLGRSCLERCASPQSQVFAL